MDDAILHDLNENEIGLLLLVNRLVSSEKTLSDQVLLPFAEFKLPDVARDYQYTMAALCEKGILQRTNEAFTLTPMGESILISVAQEHSLHAWFYNVYYQAVLHSPAHSQFCERVYGKDLSQHGMADLEQLQGLLDLEPDFYAEGNQFLFKNRIAECDGMELWQRYLFFIRPSLKDSNLRRRN
jgi:hypothetical protein